MLELTQLLERKSDKKVMMFLGLTEDENGKWLSKFLTEELEIILTPNVYTDGKGTFSSVKIDGEFKWFDNYGYFGEIDTEKFIKYYGGDSIRNFIATKGCGC